MKQPRQTQKARTKTFWNKKITMKSRKKQVKEENKNQKSQISFNIIIEDSHQDQDIHKKAMNQLQNRRNKLFASPTKNQIPSKTFVAYQNSSDEYELKIVPRPYQI